MSTRKASYSFPVCLGRRFDLNGRRHAHGESRFGGLLLCIVLLANILAICLLIRLCLASYARQQLPSASPAQVAAHELSIDVDED